MAQMSSVQTPFFREALWRTGKAPCYASFFRGKDEDSPQKKAENSLADRHHFFRLPPFLQRHALFSILFRQAAQ